MVGGGGRVGEKKVLEIYTKYLRSFWWFREKIYIFS